MSYKYFFILGSNPGLSLAEILSVFDCQIIAQSDSFVIVKSTNQIAVDDVQRLGGVIKFGEIAEQKSFSVDLCAEYIMSSYEAGEGKISYGFSVYGTDNVAVSQLRKTIASQALEIKRILKENTYSARHVISRDDTLSAVVVSKNKLLSRGVEFVAMLDHGNEYWGYTLFVQDFYSFAKRDIAKPGRSMDVGMLPPKLARMMINISGIKKNGRLLDAFCGVGTVALEAADMGIRHIVCTDISEKSLSFAHKNAELIKNEYGVELDIRRRDAQKLDPDYIGMVDAIVSEPYLGPIMQKSAQKGDIHAILNELEALYTNAFIAFSQIIVSGGSVVFVFPEWHVGGEVIRMPESMIQSIESQGFTIQQLLPDGPAQYMTDRGSIVYGRDGQQVYREIVLFKK